MDLPDTASVDLSLGEAEALARNAARGCHYSWGQAADCAAAVRWLELHQLPALHCLSERLRRMDNIPGKAACPASMKAQDLMDSTRLCPIATAGFLTDHMHALSATNELSLVEDPLLLVPVLHTLADFSGYPTSLRWTSESTDIAFYLDAGDVKLMTTGSPALLITLADKVTLTKAAKLPSDPGMHLPPRTRARISPRDLAYLTELANRTRAPESAESRARGAG